MSRKVESIHQKPILRKEGGRISNGRVEGMSAKAMVDNGDSEDFFVLVWGAPFVEGAFYAACEEGAGFGEDAWDVVVEGLDAVASVERCIVHGSVFG